MTIYLGAGNEWKQNVYYKALLYQSPNILRYLLKSKVALNKKMAPYLVKVSDITYNLDMLKMIFGYLDMREMYYRGNNKHEFRSYNICRYLIEKGFDWKSYNKTNKIKGGLDMFMKVESDIATNITLNKVLPKNVASNIMHYIISF